MILVGTPRSVAPTCSQIGLCLQVYSFRSTALGLQLQVYSQVPVGVEQFRVVGLHVQLVSFRQVEGGRGLQGLAEDAQVAGHCVLDLQQGLVVGVSLPDPDHLLGEHQRLAVLAHLPVTKVVQLEVDHVAPCPGHLQAAPLVVEPPTQRLPVPRHDTRVHLGV